MSVLIMSFVQQEETIFFLADQKERCISNQQRVNIFLGVEVFIFVGTTLETRTQNFSWCVFIPLSFGIY